MKVKVLINRYAGTREGEIEGGGEIVGGEKDDREKERKVNALTDKETNR